MKEGGRRAIPLLFTATAWIGGNFHFPAPNWSSGKGISKQCETSTSYGEGVCVCVCGGWGGRGLVLTIILFRRTAIRVHLHKCAPALVSVRCPPRECVSKCFCSSTGGLRITALFQFRTPGGVSFFLKSRHDGPLQRAAFWEPVSSSFFCQPD